METNKFLAVPYQSQFLDANGNISQPWLEFFTVVVQKIDEIESSSASDGVNITALKSAATSMTNIADQSVATATQIANYWQDFRSDLQSI